MMSPRGDGRAVLTLTAAVVIVADITTKAIATHRGSVHINPGVAFGFLAGTPAVAFAVSSLVTLAVVLAGWALVRSRLIGLGAGLIIGGALANALDRSTPKTPQGVIDWIQFSPYPAYFNLADVAIRGGAVLIVGLLIAGSVSSPRRGLGAKAATTSGE